jgi:hypothetical protein
MTDDSFVQHMLRILTRKSSETVLMIDTLPAFAGLFENAASDARESADSGAKLLGDSAGYNPHQIFGVLWNREHFSGLFLNALDKGAQVDHRFPLGGFVQSN